MSVASKTQIARRPLLKILAGATALAAAGIVLVEAPKLFAPRHPPSPYDDLLAQLPDRDGAVRIGAAYLAGQERFDAAREAANLRRRLASQPLAALIEDDISKANMGEAHGWALPDALLAICALAVKAG